MLELYFKYPRVLRRLRDGELGGEMDRIAGYISEAGYKRESAKIYLSWLGRFSDHLWHAARNTPINQAVIDALVDAYPTKAPRLAARTAIELARKVVP
jgi:integrase/recombinase XerD